VAAGAIRGNRVDRGAKAFVVDRAQKLGLIFYSESGLRGRTRRNATAAQYTLFFAQESVPRRAPPLSQGGYEVLRPNDPDSPRNLAGRGDGYTLLLTHRCRGEAAYTYCVPRGAIVHLRLCLRDQHHTSQQIHAASSVVLAVWRLSVHLYKQMRGPDWTSATADLSPGVVPVDPPV
jgi:hypothetical protein